MKSEHPNKPTSRWSAVAAGARQRERDPSLAVLLERARRLLDTTPELRVERDGGGHAVGVRRGRRAVLAPDGFEEDVDAACLFVEDGPALVGELARVVNELDRRLRAVEAVKGLGPEVVR